MQKRKRHYNFTAIISFLVLTISAFTLPTISMNADFFFISFNLGIMPLIQLTITEFGSSPISNSFQINALILFLFIFYLGIIALYFLNGLGYIRSKYSRYASILCFAYLFLGLLFITLLNVQYSGKYGILSSFASFGAGMGIWIVPLIGGINLLLWKRINKIFGDIYHELDK